MNLLKNAQFQTVFVDSTSTSKSTDSTSVSVLDTAGFDSVCYIGMLSATDVGALGCDVALRLYHSDSSGGTYYACATSYSASCTEASTHADAKTIVLDVVNPVKRWHSIYIDRGAVAANGVRVDVVAVKYNPTQAPVTQSTENYGVAASALAVSPTS